MRPHGAMSSQGTSYVLLTMLYALHPKFQMVHFLPQVTAYGLSKYP